MLETVEVLPPRILRHQIDEVNTDAGRRERVEVMDMFSITILTGEMRWEKKEVL